MPCQFGKQTALPFNNRVSHALSPFNLIHYDVWSPSPITTQCGSRYFVIFEDDFSQYTWIYIFKNRFEIYQIYRDFTKMIETRFSKLIKVFRSDNAQEYKAYEFTSIFHQFGIVPHSPCVGTSQQNGRAERKLRHILDVVRATTIAASTPSQFLGEAVLIVVYTINRCPSPIVQNQTPYDLLFGSSPSYDLFRVFGCVCFVLLQDHERNKLQSRSCLCCFLGYGIGQKGYRCYDPISKRLCVSRHVVFWEHKIFYELPHVPVSPIPSTILSLTFFLRSLPLLCLSTPTWSLSFPFLFLMFILMHLMSFPHRSSMCPLILPQLWILPVFLTPIHFVVPIG